MSFLEYSSLLRRRPAFRRLFIADAFSQLGQNMLYVAFPTLLLEVTHDVTLTGIAFSGEIVAYGLLAPWAGLAADRFEQKRLMVIANLGRAILLFTLLYCLPQSHSLGFYLLLSLLLGACGALFTPARAAFLRRLLEGEELVQAATLEGTMMFLLRLVSPAFIGVVVLLANARVGIAFDACFYVASLAVLAPRWVNGPWKGSEVEGRAVLVELYSGWRTIRTTPTLHQLLVLDFCVSVVGMATWSTAVAFLEMVVHVPAVNNGWLQASMGLSGALGTRLGAGLRAHPGTVARLITGVAASYLLLTQCTTLQGIIGVWFLRGLIIGMMVVLISREMARRVSAEVMGRVQAAWDQVACLACFCGSVATPWLLRQVGAVGAFRIYAAIMVVLVALWWIRLWRSPVAKS